jgi:hypothetical protein
MYKVYPDKLVVEIGKFLVVKNNIPSTATIIITDGNNIFKIVLKNIDIAFIPFRTASLKIVVPDTFSDLYSLEIADIKPKESGKINAI